MAELVPFLSPHLVGQRFSGHSIPLEVLKDLAVLEEMVVEVAKWRFLVENPERKRSPRGFTDGISLRLTEIEDGSAIPKIMLFLAASSPTLFPPTNQTYFEQARDSIVSAVDAAEREEDVHPHLPDSLLGYFDRLGRSLREGESIEFRPSDPQRPARLNRTTRRRLVLASTQVTELTEEVVLRGGVPEADQDRMTFTIQLVNGQRIVAPLTPQNKATVMEAFNGYRDGLRLVLHGVAKYNRAERIQSVESVEHINILDPNDVPARLEELRLLKDGWLDGKGTAPAAAGLDWFGEIFDSNYPDGMPLPYVYPTAEGGLQLEWTLDAYEASLEVDLVKHTGEWQGVDTETDGDEWRELNLEDVGDWQWLATRLAGLVGEEA